MTAYQKLYTGIGRAAWGYFFIYFDFNINTVSILPSFIGYMLFLSAINCLCEEERELNLLRTLGVILTVWHVASWLASWGSIDLDGMLQVDEIKQRGMISQAFEYFLQDEEVVKRVRLPDDLFDPCHEIEVLQGMISLIRGRNSQGSWLAAYCNDVTALQTKPRDIILCEPSDELTCRERFDAVFSLIPKQIKERAKKHFVEKTWEFLDNYFEQISILKRKQAELASESERAAKDCFALKQQIEERRNSAVRNNPPIDFSKLTANISATYSDRQILRSPFSPLSGELAELEKKCKYGMEILEKADNANAMYKTFKVEAFVAGEISEGRFPVEELPEFDEEAVEKMSLISVADPYEICFGLLCLIEEGNDFPWIYNPVASVLRSAASQLPWNVILPVEEEMDEDDYDETEEFDENEEDCALDDDLECGEDEIEQPIIDWTELKAALYRKQYTNAVLFAPLEPPQKPQRINLPQIVYGMTHTVMPRNVWEYDGMVEDLCNEGMESKEAEMLQLYFNLSSATQFSTKNWKYFLSTQVVQDLMAKDEDDLPESEAANDESEDVKKLLEINSKLKGTIDELKQTLYAVSKELKDAKAELEEQENRNEVIRQEVSNLRTIVFNRKEEAEHDDGELDNDESMFPYTTKHRIVVFGGHETWLKAIKPRLPEVVFVDKTVVPNENMIRKADMIWIQSNAIGHAFYYKILDVTRKWDIPLHYFSFASAYKCAIQLVDEDKKELPDDCQQVKSFVILTKLTTRGIISLDYYISCTHRWMRDCHFI